MRLVISVDLTVYDLDEKSNLIYMPRGNPSRDVAKASTRPF
jgi:glucose dehydrogenase